MNERVQELEYINRPFSRTEAIGLNKIVIDDMIQIELSPPANFAEPPLVTITTKDGGRMIVVRADGQASDVNLLPQTPSEVPFRSPKDHVYIDDRYQITWIADSAIWGTFKIESTEDINTQKLR